MARLDAVMVQQGMVPSRQRAKTLIQNGQISVNGKVCTKPAFAVSETDRIAMEGSDIPFVGRGGLKLEHAVQQMRLSLEGMVCLDIGASTGGFTDCMLQNGAVKVYSVDVGHGQLDWKLRSNPQVVNMEKTNIKVVTKDLLGEMVDFISTDVSFISVTKIIPAVHSILKEEGSLVILIKPQFEAGREKVGKGGIIKDPKVHAEVIEDTLEAFKEEHLYCHGLTYSPIKGGSGNIEFLAWLKQTPPEKEIRAADMVKVVEEAHSGLKG